MLIIHIVLSILASAGIIVSASKIASKKSNLSNRQLVGLWTLTGSSVLSGAALILAGAGVARVCVEAGVLLVGAVAVNVLSRKNAAMFEKQVVLKE